MIFIFYFKIIVFYNSKRKNINFYYCIGNGWGKRTGRDKGKGEEDIVSW